MGNQAFGNIQIITRKQDFSHDVAFVAKIFDVVLDSQIIKAIAAVIWLVQLSATVAVNDVVAILDKFESDIPAAFHHESIFGFQHHPHDCHQRCLSASDWSCQYDSLIQIQIVLLTHLFIAEEVGGHLHQDFFVVWAKREIKMTITATEMGRSWDCFSLMS